MIRVTIELLPFGNDNDKVVIGVVNIANIGYVSLTGSDKCKYSYRGIVSREDHSSEA